MVHNIKQHFLDEMNAKALRSCKVVSWKGRDGKSSYESYDQRKRRTALLLLLEGHFDHNTFLDHLWQCGFQVAQHWAGSPNEELVKQAEAELTQSSHEKLSRKSHLKSNTNESLRASACGICGFCRVALLCIPLSTLEAAEKKARSVQRQALQETGGRRKQSRKREGCLRISCAFRSVRLSSPSSFVHFVGPGLPLLRPSCAAGDLHAAPAHQARGAQARASGGGALFFEVSSFGDSFGAFKGTRNSRATPQRCRRPCPPWPPSSRRPVGPLDEGGSRSNP